MDRLWAPWRMAYILEPEREPGCILCNYPPRGPSPETLVLRVEERAFVMMNRYPYINGHLMICPLAHVPSLSALSAEDLAATSDLLARSVSIVERVMRPHGLNVGMNIGRVAGAGIEDHVHFHVVPRWNGDHNFMPVLTGTRVISQGLAEAYELLRPAFT